MRSAGTLSVIFFAWAMVTGGCAASSSTAASPSGHATATGTTRPSGPLVINVTVGANRWSFEYPGGKVSDELHLSPGSSVQFRVTSLDVVHAMLIQEMRVKVDAIPKQVQTGDGITPHGALETRLHCAEYCGPRHSTCGAKVIIHDPGGFEAWLAARSKPTDSSPSS